jgi:hypothetical protein
MAQNGRFFKQKQGGWESLPGVMIPVLAHFLAKNGDASFEEKDGMNAEAVASR